MIPRSALPVVVLLVSGCASEERSFSPPSAKHPRIRAELSTLNVSGLARRQSRVTEKDGRVSVYEGVALADVLALMGVKIGVHPKGQHPVEYVVVEAADGYRALFSKAELDPAFVESGVLLADHHDGQVLP